MTRLIAFCTASLVVIFGPLIVLQLWTLATTGGYSRSCGCVVTIGASGDPFLTACPVHELEADEKRMLQHTANMLKAGRIPAIATTAE
ncbi:MAG: hypothetical protein JWN70_6540 [Planctomycetaceae bacterium]|nr:hypothetical protein [Planctomycetaceae bacterium]